MSDWDTPLISPVSPISPNTTISGPSGLFRNEETREKHMPRSSAGSSTETPPATFIKMSSPIMLIPAILSSTATSSEILFESIPILVLLGTPIPPADTSAWISIRIGRVPSILADTTEPDALVGLSDKNISEGFFTSTRPSSLISKTPISFVDPNLFLIERIIRYWLPLPPSK